MLVLDRPERIGPRRHDLHHQGSAVVDLRQSGGDRGEVEVPVAQAAPRRVGDLHVPEPPAGQANRRRRCRAPRCWRGRGRGSCRPPATRRRRGRPAPRAPRSRGRPRSGSGARPRSARRSAPRRGRPPACPPPTMPTPRRGWRSARDAARPRRASGRAARRSPPPAEAAPDVVDRDASDPRVGMGEVALGRQPAGRRQRDGREPVIAQPAAEIRGRPAAGLAGKLHAVEAGGGDAAERLRERRVAVDPRRHAEAAASQGSHRSLPTRRPLRRATMRSWMRPFEATMVASSTSKGWPAPPVTRPPASRTSSAPAATSQGCACRSQ